MFNIAIFDFDGTIADTQNVIIATTKATIEAMNLPHRTDAQCRRVIGLPMQDTFGALFPELKDDTPLFTKIYRDLYQKIGDTIPVSLFPHVRETLDRMKAANITMTIASSRNRVSLEQYLDQLNLTDYFSYILGGQDTEKAKPDPMPVLKTLSELGFKAKDAIVIGDTYYDILMGKRADAHTCGVTYGNGSRQEFIDSGADWIIDDFAHLANLLINAGK